MAELIFNKGAAEEMQLWPGELLLSESSHPVVDWQSSRFGQGVASTVGFADSTLGLNQRSVQSLPELIEGFDYPGSLVLDRPSPHGV